MKTLFFTAASGLVLGLSLIAGIAALLPSQPKPEARKASAALVLEVGPTASQPDRVLGGYSGTQFERELELASQPEFLEHASIVPAQPDRPLAPPKTKPGWTPPAGAWRWKQEATRAQFPDIAARLSITADYAQSLQLMAGLAGKLRSVWQPQVRDGETRMEYMGEATRFTTMPTELAAVLFEAFNKARGCARQNIIFHVAQALPREFWRPWLNALRHGADTEDSEDALCALAFLGEPEAQENFEQLSRQPAPVDANRIVDRSEEHDVLAKAGERAFLRSYRCIETLDGGPYFTAHSWASGTTDGKFPWCDRAAGLDAQAKRMLPLWMSRYPGHPGSDDMAFRLARLALGEGRNLEALELASCCATYPDQDMVRSGTSLLLFIAECVVTRSELATLLSRGHTRNRSLLHYIYMRRTALDQGPGVALRDLRIVSEAEPDLDVSIAYNTCWARDACDGIDSGLAPLAAHDPLKQVHGNRGRDGDYSNPGSLYFYRHRATLEAGEKRDKDRLYRHDPPREAVEMSLRRLGAQFRCWETLEELAARKTDENPAPDLHYKMAAVRYHQRVFVPCYVDDSNYFSGHGSVRFARNAEQQAAFESYCRKASRYLDAASCFDALWPSELNAELRAKELFSAGLSWISAASTNAWIAATRKECIVNGVDRFEQLAREYPASNLADDASNAARYWRRNYAHCWSDASVLGK